MISFSLNVIALILGASAVTLQSSDGINHSGALVQLDEAVAVVETDKGRMSVPIDNLLRVSNGDVSPKKIASTTTVNLTDGTILGAISFEMGETANVGVTEESVVQINPRNLSTVRFQKPTQRGPLDKQWDEFTSKEREGDLLIVRKGKKLSYLEGLIRGADSKTIDFVYDGDDFAVKQKNVEGLCFLTKPIEEKRPSRVVYTVGSGVLNAQSVRYTADGLVVALLSGDTITLPMSAVRGVDYGASQIVYLSSLDPYKVTVTPRLLSSTLGELASRLLYQPAVNKSLSGGQLSLPSVVPGGARQYFDTGLALHSRTEMIYRIEGGDYRRLQGIAGIDPDLRQQGAVRLLIEGDEAPLLEANIGPGDPPLPIDVSVEGVRRLRILVDYGDTLDAGDHLNLCEIRLTP